MNIPVISPLLGKMIYYLDMISPNYLVTLLLFAVVIKILLFPLGIKQQKNSVKQATLRPKEMAIRKKYAGRTDNATKQKINEEIMALYQRENFNPASGCLPMLLQLPILFALYSVIINPLQYLINGATKASASAFVTRLGELKESAAAGFENLTRMDQVSAIDKIIKYPEHFQDLFNESITLEAVENLATRFEVLGMNLLDVPSWSSILIVVPILTLIVSFASTKIIRKFTYQPTPAEGAPNMAIMDWTMPLMSLWICFQVSAAIGIYWIAQNLLGAVQQIILSKMYPIPVITDQQIKEAELQLKGKSSKASQHPRDNSAQKSIVAPAPLKKDRKTPEIKVKGRLTGASPKVSALVKGGKKLVARRKI